MIDVDQRRRRALEESCADFAVLVDCLERQKQIIEDLTDRVEKLSFRLERLEHVRADFRLWGSKPRKTESSLLPGAI